MKKRYCLYLSLTFALLVSLSGCKEKSPDAKAPESMKSSGAAGGPVISTAPPYAGGPQTSFHEVTSQLDRGGSAFVYLATDQWLSGLSTNLTRIQDMLLAMPGPSMEEREHIERTFGVLTRVIQKSGVEDVTGVGLSGAPVAPGLFRNKLILHHPPGAGQGFLWSLFGKSPHSMAGQSMLPTNTAFAAFGDLDIAQVWQVLERELSQSGVPEIERAIAAWPEEFEKETEMAWPKLLESLGGEVGFLLTLDDSKTVSIPVGATSISIPAPGVLLAAKVNNDLLFDRLSEELNDKPGVITTNEAGLKICAMPIPLPLPVALELVLATSGDYFFFATSRDLVRNVQAARTGQQPGLSSSAEFKSLAAHLPDQGNQFIYVGKRFGEVFAELQAQVLEGSPMPPDQRDLFRQMMGAANTAYSLSIGSHTSTGWQTVSVGNKDSSSAIVLAPTVGVAAFSAGLLLPALAKAKAKAQTISSVNNLKQLGLAARMYANDNQNKFPNAATWSDELKDYLGSEKVYKAPSDSSPARCSYAFNIKLSGRSEQQINPSTVLFFEAAEGDWNLSGGRELMPLSPRGSGVFVVGFADGSVQQVPVSRVNSLRWEP